ncbi:unnamed protein product [Heligmosomoides polygyrus]|uniref:Piwi domain-containing protein n=1 Tax=Heligmosomoides polygyrus TaxID=6339 RepID=A0A183GF50_HELPZ|nr:unnamed protein product [Heligmosomoides polygyrus]
MLPHQKAGGMYGFGGATASNEATLIAMKLDDVTNSSVYNSLKNLHAARKQANRTSITIIFISEVVVKDLLLEAPTHYIRVFREVCSGFTPMTSPFYNGVVISGDTRRDPRKRHARTRIGSMGVKIDGRPPHNLRFVQNVVLITPRIIQAVRMLADVDRICGNVGLQLNLSETMFMRNGNVSDAAFSLNRTNISECYNYVYLGH